MTWVLEQVVILVTLAAVIGTAAFGLGIFFLAPRLSRLIDRNDEDAGAGDD